MAWRRSVAISFMKRQFFFEEAVGNDAHYCLACLIAMRSRQCHRQRAYGTQPASAPSARSHGANLKFGLSRTDKAKAFRPLFASCFLLLATERIALEWRQVKQPSFWRGQNAWENRPQPPTWSGPNKRTGWRHNALQGVAAGRGQAHSKGQELRTTVRSRRPAVRCRCLKHLDIAVSAQDQYARISKKKVPGSAS